MENPETANAIDSSEILLLYSISISILLLYAGWANNMHYIRTTYIGKRSYANNIESHWLFCLKILVLQKLQNTT